MKGLTYSRIKNILHSCAFKPNADGPLRTISEIGDPRYYGKRACEMVKESENSPEEGRILLLKLAISLLALSIAETELKEVIEPLPPCWAEDSKKIVNGEK